MESFCQGGYKDEREDVQKKTFTKWINSQLIKNDKVLVTDLFFDLRDGTKLLALLEVLTSKKFKREKGSMRVHNISNVDKALKVLEENQVKLVNISNELIVDGSPKITLGLVWSIILRWQVQGVLKEVMAELQQTNLEKTLLAWCRQATQGYEGVDIKNFTTSWTDGLAFNAILHRHQPKLFDWILLVRRHPHARLEHAFRIAQERFNIQMLLDPEDVNTQVPDKKSLMMYVMCFFEALPTSSFTMDSQLSVEDAEEDFKGRPLSLVSIGLGSYQQTLEEVLTWLLEAEDKLASMPPIGECSSEVKKQFHALEHIMLELTERQGGIGDVLSEGSKLLKESMMGEEEAEEVRVQMKLLNTRWEDLRVKAMDRQSSLHDELMKLQQDELDILRKWLTSTEDRIGNMSQLGPTFQNLKEQLEQHSILQADIEAEQESINSLSNMVVVVDDSGSDSAYAALEDELTALGERWAHICKWAEKRCSVLQSLNVNWEELDTEKGTLEEWITSNEKSVREIESNPEVNEIEILEQALSLKMVKVEMDIQTRRLNELQDKSNIVLENLTPDSAAHEVIPAQLEMLQDRLECLTSSLEAQTQRIFACGIDLNTIGVPSGVKNSMDESNTDEGEQLRAKRQKLSTSKHQDFSAALENIKSWMEQTELRLTSDDVQKMDSKQLEVLVVQLEDEVKQREIEFDEVICLGQAAVSECVSLGDSPIDDETKMSSLKSHWTNIIRNMEISRERIGFLEDFFILKEKLLNSSNELHSVEIWINRVQSTTAFDISVVEHQIEECLSNKKDIQKNLKNLDGIEDKAKKLSFSFSKEKGKFCSSVNKVRLDWRNLVMRIDNWETILEDNVRVAKSESMDDMEATSEMDESLVPDFEEISVWLNNIENALESCPVLTLIPIMEEHFNKMKILQKKEEEERGKLSSVNKRFEGTESSSISKHIEELNTTWNRAVERLKKRMSDLDRGIYKINKFNNDTNDLSSWLSEVESFLDAEDAAVGDVETLNAQMKESNALQLDIVTLRMTITKIMDTGNNIKSCGDDTLKKCVKKQMRELSERWDSAVLKATKQNVYVKDALDRTLTFQSGISELSLWMDLAESKLSEYPTIETTSELNSAFENISGLFMDLRGHSNTFQTISELAEEMVEERKESHFVEIAFEAINVKFIDIRDRVRNIEENLRMSKYNYDRFKELTAKESEWLDTLEAKMEKSANTLLNPEEIVAVSEDISSYMANIDCDSFDEFPKLADNLVARGVMTVVVQNTTHNLTSRLDRLSTKAFDHKIRLEGGVEEAQEIEKEYVAALERLSDIQLLFNHFLQPNKLEEIEMELEKLHSTFDKMEKQVEGFKSQEKTQVAARIKSQLDDLWARYQATEEKLKVCQQSGNYEARLERVSGRLNKINEKTRVVGKKSVLPVDIETNLNTCMETYKSLSDVKAEVESVIGIGRKMVKEGIAPDSASLTLQLDELKGLYNDLGSTVTEQRGKLEGCFRYSRKIFKELPQLEDYLNSSEKELDDREATLGLGKIELEMLFAKNLLDDVGRKNSVINGVKESLDNLSGFCTNEVTSELKDRLIEAMSTRERLQTRLNNRIDRLQNEAENRDKGMETFILRIGTIKAWLEEAEKEITKINTIPLKDRNNAFRKVRDELEENRKEIEKAQLSASSLVRKGTLFQSKLEPELNAISRRWHLIHESIKKQETFSKSSSFFEVNPDAKEKPEMEAYFREVSEMADVIATLRNKGNADVTYTEAMDHCQEFEQGVACIEPDVATLISRGDTLTLTTHIVCVNKSNSVRVAVNDLRRCWMNLKIQVETLRAEVNNVISEMKTGKDKATFILDWLNEVESRLKLANNVEQELFAVQKEVSDNVEEVERINTSNEILKRYDYNERNYLVDKINFKWLQVNNHLSNYEKGFQTKSGNAFYDDEKSQTVVADFLAGVNTIREEIVTISHNLNTSSLTAKHYDNLFDKEKDLKAVKIDLEILKPNVNNVESERLNVIKNSTAQQTDQLRKVIDKLREEWAQLNRSYTDKHTLWLQCSETWHTFNKTLNDLSSWLDATEERLKLSKDETIPEASATQKDLEKQITLKHRPSQTLQAVSREITSDINCDIGHKLQAEVEKILKRWRALLVEVAARRERITHEELTDEKNSDYEAIVRWIEQAEILSETPVNITEEDILSAHASVVKNHLSGSANMRKKLESLKVAKFQSTGPIPLSTTEVRFFKSEKLFEEYVEKVHTKFNVLSTLVTDSEDLDKWMEQLEARFALGNLNKAEINRIQSELEEQNAFYETLDHTYWALAQDAEGKSLPTSVMLKTRMNSIESRLKSLETHFSTDELLKTFKDEASREVACELLVEKRLDLEPPATVETGSTVASSVTNVIQNVVRLKESVNVNGDDKSRISWDDPNSPTLILAALDKSILQIRDWLTLMEQMSKNQTTVVGDDEDIRRLIEKQKSVLRELESKKPQLDELVSSADGLKGEEPRGQMHQQVSKLREHWDETSNSVLARKTQLDAILVDTQKFESKRLELENWLARMEAKLTRLTTSTYNNDILDHQIREQKSMQAEIFQYRHQIELFAQMTQRLCTIYPSDDTRRVKKAAESINLRFNNLNSSINSRGKGLHGSISSNHHFGKASDKFMSWMCKAESSATGIDKEVDNIPPLSGSMRRNSYCRPTIIHLKDLQSEIENHKDVLASLNATGQKLLGTLENKDDAVILHKRLDDMNHRWNTLKHKSIAIRNRLEGTAENWNSLLLSLRELIEWVIRKDTELTALGSPIGDVNILTKYEENLSIFKRNLDEKQPIVESNITSGRQLIASEPPLSDTSDSEAGRELEGDSRYRGEESARELTRAVRREVAKLSEKWGLLRQRVLAALEQATLANKKLSVLLKTVEEVGSRLEENEKVIAEVGPISQDQTLSEQFILSVRKLREKLPDLQRGIDDVNDQAARFSIHNVPLTPANSAALHDLNNRWKNMETTVSDWWRTVAGRSRDITPLTPAQLAASVNPPWERATAASKVPYFINHAQETTHWDHPDMIQLIDSLCEFNHIKFSAYRTASKLRTLQKKLGLDLAKLQMVADVFDEHGLRGQNDRLIDVGDMIVVLSTLYGRIVADYPEVNASASTDLCLNWLLNVYDSQRTGQLRVLSFRVGLVCLCRGHLEEKYRYMFRLIADPNRQVDQRKLGLLLHDCVQVPRQLGEVAAFGGSNIEPSVRSCFVKAGKDKDTIEAVHFLTWVQQEPQSLVWLAVLHRVAASERIQHQVKCNICKTYPIVGLRYRCLKCLSFDMCQRCFFDGKSGKSHKITHPMHEYCTATTAGDEMKDFTKALKNKFKSKRSLQKHTKKGYLPVQTVLEGDALESPSPSPSHASHDMHSRLELYASRLAEVELRTNYYSTPDSEDEHGLIAQYCQSLSSCDGTFPVPRSPLQIMASVDADQKDELEQMIRDLEEENRALQAEYDRLKLEQPPDYDDPNGVRTEVEMLAEAKLLREHKGRLEARMSILEDHNRQLEAQLNRLRHILDQHGGVSSPTKNGTLQTRSVTASQLAVDSPAKVNGHSNQGELEKAVGHLVESMSPETENGSLNSTVDDYDNVAVNGALPHVATTNGT